MTETRHPQKLLGRIGWIAGLLGIVGLFLIPHLIRFQAKAKYSDFLDEAAIEKMTSIQIEDSLPSRLIALFLSVASMVLGHALLRRQNWAKWPWLGLCVSWLAYYLVDNPWEQMAGSDVVAVIFRLVVLFLSLSMLKRSAS